MAETAFGHTWPAETIFHAPRFAALAGWAKIACQCRSCARFGARANSAGALRMALNGRQTLAGAIATLRNFVPEKASCCPLLALPAGPSAKPWNGPTGGAGAGPCKCPFRPRPLTRRVSGKPLDGLASGLPDWPQQAHLGVLRPQPKPAFGAQ